MTMKGLRGCSFYHLEFQIYSSILVHYADVDVHTYVLSDTTCVYTLSSSSFPLSRSTRRDFIVALPDDLPSYMYYLRTCMQHRPERETTDRLNARKATDYAIMILTITTTTAQKTLMISYPMTGRLLLRSPLCIPAPSVCAPPRTPALL